MPREKFTFWRSYLDAFDKLPEDHRLEFISALLHYAMDGTEPVFEKSILYAVFAGVRKNIDYGKERSGDGRRGGQAERNGNPQGGFPEDSRGISNPCKGASEKNEACFQQDESLVEESEKHYHSHSDISHTTSDISLSQAVELELQQANIQKGRYEREIRDAVNFYGEGLVIDAIRIGGQNGAKSWAYVRRVLESVGQTRPKDKQGGPFQRHGEPISPMMATAARRLLEQEQAEEAGE